MLTHSLFESNELQSVVMIKGFLFSLWPTNVLQTFGGNMVLSNFRMGYSCSSSMDTAPGKLKSVSNKRFHGFCHHIESGHSKLADRMKYMANTAEELSAVGNVSTHL